MCSNIFQDYYDDNEDWRNWKDDWNEEEPMDEDYRMHNEGKSAPASKLLPEFSLFSASFKILE